MNEKDPAFQQKIESERHGTFSAFQPEYLNTDGTWARIPTTHSNEPDANGLHFPLAFGGVMQEAWVYGKAQAMAIAWGWAAELDARKGKCPTVRVKELFVKYDIVVTDPTTNPTDG